MDYRSLRVPAVLCELLTDVTVMAFICFPAMCRQQQARKLGANCLQVARRNGKYHLGIIEANNQKAFGRAQRKKLKHHLYWYNFG